MHWNLAVLAYEYKVSPADLMQLEPRMLWTMGRLLEHVKHQQRKR